MAYVKKDPAYVSEMRAKAGRISAKLRKEKGLHFGGRKKLPDDVKVPKYTTINAYVCDRDVLNILAKSKGVSSIALLHIVCERLKEKNPEIFRH